MYEASSPVARDAFVKSPKAAPHPTPPSALASFKPAVQGADDLPQTVREIPVSPPAEVPPEGFYKVPPDVARIIFGRDPGPRHDRRPTVAIADASDLPISREEFVLSRENEEWLITHGNRFTKLVIRNLDSKEEREFRSGWTQRIEPGRYTVQVCGKRMAFSPPEVPAVPPRVPFSDWLVDDERDKMMLPRAFFLEIPEVPRSWTPTGEHEFDEVFPTIRSSPGRSVKTSEDEETYDHVVRLITRVLIARGEADAAAREKASAWQATPVEEILETIEGLLRFGGGTSPLKRKKEDWDERCRTALRAEVQKLQVLVDDGTATSDDLGCALDLFQQYGELGLATDCGMAEADRAIREVERERFEKKLTSLRSCGEDDLQRRFEEIVLAATDAEILSAMEVLADRLTLTSLSLTRAGSERLARLIDAGSSGDALALALFILDDSVFADVAQAVGRLRRLGNLPLRAPEDPAQLAALQAALDGHVRVTMDRLLLSWKRLRGCVPEDASAIEREIEQHIERTANLLRVAGWLGFTVDQEKSLLAAVDMGARASFRSSREGPLDLPLIRRFYRSDVEGRSWDDARLAPLRQIADEIFTRHLPPDVIADLGDDERGAYDIFRGQASLLPGDAREQKRSFELPAAKEGFLKYGQGFVWYIPKGCSAEERKDVGRYYITLAPEGYAGKVGAVVEALQGVVLEAGGTVHFKVSENSGIYGSASRRDQVVIYFSASEGERLLAALTAMMDRLAADDPKLFSEKGPYFAERLRDGLFFGQSPPSGENGESFGSVRAEALLRTVRELAWLTEGGQAVESEFRVRILATFLQEAGVDPVRPAFNRGGAARFPYL